MGVFKIACLAAVLLAVGVTGQHCIPDDSCRSGYRQDLSGECCGHGPVAPLKNKVVPPPKLSKH